MKNIRQFFDLAIERQAIKLKRERGDKPPWTGDYVLGNYRFCNVHRRDDRVSKWIIDNLFEPLKGRPEVFWASYVARWLNKIETLEAVKDLIVDGQDLEAMRKRLREIDSTVFGAAYIIQSPTGMDKIDGIVWAMGNVTKSWKDGVELAQFHNRMEIVHRWLQQFPHMGPFMAYQVVCDLTYTHLLNNAEDKMTWTCAGPGAARGLGWLVKDNPDTFNYTSKADQGMMLATMQAVLAASEVHWPNEFGPWELATVQHWSCEYDKWRRGQNGERLKRRYEPCT